MINFEFMNKNKRMRDFFNIIVWVIFPLIVFSQNNKSIQVTYVKAYKNYRDTTSTAPEIYKGIEYKLIGNKNEAIFEYIPSMENDANRKHKFLISRGGGSGVYYTSIKDKEKLHQVVSPFNNEKYLIKSSTNEYKWKITNEKKTISGYTCYKATASYEVEIPISRKKTKKSIKTITVWFTPEINFSYGPAGFDGLPGLVLEKTAGSYYFIASKIVFKENQVSVEKPVKGTILSKEQFRLESLKQVRKLD